MFGALCFVFVVFVCFLCESYSFRRKFGADFNACVFIFKPEFFYGFFFMFFLYEALSFYKLKWVSTERSDVFGLSSRVLLQRCTGLFFFMV